MRYLVGISGFKRSGKNTFADVLRQVAHERGLAFVAVAFADPLRRAAAVAYGVDVSNFTDDAKKDTLCEAWGITYRQMLINLGEAMRSVDADHWVKALKQQVLQDRLLVSAPSEKGPVDAWCRLDHLSHYTLNGKALQLLVAVTDVRRVNEAVAVHDLGGVNVLVRRPGIVWDGHVNEELMHWAGQQREGVFSFHGCVYKNGQLCYNEATTLTLGHNEAASYQQTFPATRPSVAGRAVFDHQLDNDAASVEATMTSMRRHAEVVVEMATRQPSRSS